jgi:outer membrane receptor protein involved in Fe transport
LEFLLSHFRRLPIVAMPYWGLMLGVALAPSQILAQSTSAQRPAETIVVTAARADAATRLDRKVFHVDRDLQGQAGSAADVLGNLPSVSVSTDGAVSLRGDSNVTILIDGKPNSALSGPGAGIGLLQMPANNIDRIEVMTQPSAEYSANGTGGIINIITKRNQTSGISGRVSVNLGNEGRANASASVTSKKDKLTLTGALNFRQDHRDRVVNSNRIFSAVGIRPSSFTTHNVKEVLDPYIGSITLSGEYALSDRQSFGASISHSERDGPRDFIQTDISRTAVSTITSDRIRFSDGKEWRLDASENLHYRATTAAGHTIALQVQHGVQLEREDYAYINQYRTPLRPNSQDRLNLVLDLKTWQVSADLSMPWKAEGISDATIKLGYDLATDFNNFNNRAANRDAVSGQFINNPSVTNHFEFDQAVNALYLSVQATSGKIDWVAGLRGEHTGVRSNQISQNITNTRSYAVFFPSLHLAREVAEGRIVSLSLAKRQQRPNPEELNPFLDSQDTQNLRAGNPNLRPQITQSFELDYTITRPNWRTDVTLYVRDSRDGVTDIATPLGNDVVLQTKANLPQSIASGAEFQWSGKPLKNWSANVSANIYSVAVDSTALDNGLKQTAITGTLKATLDWQVNEKSHLQMSGNWSGKRLTAQGSIEPVGALNLGYRYQFSPDIALVATLSDALNSQTFLRRYATPLISDAYERQQAGRVFYIGISRNFGSGRRRNDNFEFDK